MSAKTTVRGVVLFGALAVVLPAARVEAQTGPAPPGDSPVAVYRVRHDHAVGSGSGEMRITNAGIEFRGEGDEAKDSRVWRDEDIKRLEIHEHEIEVFVYEAARVPVLPPHVPFVKTSKAVRIGSEREYEFHLVEGEVTPDVVRVLLARFKRPIATTVVPGEPEDSGTLLFEIPVFHQHARGGESGVLRVYERHVVFVADIEDHSRHWRFSDIRDMARLGRYGFEVATYEDSRWTDGKSYIFDLKRPMTDAEYETLWKRLYLPEPKANVP